MESRARIEAELAYAQAARDHGKEGRARVCARRAAGWAIAARYLNSPERGAVNQLRWLEKNAEAAPELRSAARRLTQRVTKTHDLPHPEDPLEDAQLIVSRLLGDGS